MSTQHPDNVNVPEWSTSEIIDGNAEIFEAYFAYGTLGCQEVMWDSEGKDADTRVARKLLNNYPAYFQNHILGRDIFLTYRIPNPKIEKVERKVVIETLQNIPVAYDVASSFYRQDITPIFEVILPYTTDATEPITLFNYYQKAIIADEEVVLHQSTRVKDWVGTFKPKKISVIPLVEDYRSLLAIDKIVKPYIKAAKPRHLRVFIARSDPALNYGLICAVLLSKIALSKLKTVEKQLDVPVHPIIGVGSKPFRGHLAPDNAEKFLQEYKGLTTVTIQSAVRYDYPLEQVKDFIRILNAKLPNGEPAPIEPHEEKLMHSVLDKCKRQYESTIEKLAPLVNSVSAYVPPRRARKLHIGLFGYSRNVAGVNLPRAITFAAALYSIGLPPEFIGAKALEKLNDAELDLVEKYYVNLKHDLSAVGGYVSWQNVNMFLEMHQKVAERAGASQEKLKEAFANVLDDLQTVEEKLNIKLGPYGSIQKRHENFANNFLISWLEHEDGEARKALIEAAKLRRCLG
ncbi:phosphoenolpyruvate carboxylase [Candidatus Bathyarchaeota archaeon A05DMB-2]|jgi:phosphoenolpyruvate carboxylase|nr:phosphoenolpyruvate carboxylase [Candidatus Bathyarchaeota archaeon A05DMB-2]